LTSLRGTIITLRGSPADESLHVLLGKRRGADLLLAGIDRHRDLAAQLAVDLHDHRHRAGCSAAGSGCGQRSSISAPAVAERLPQSRGRYAGRSARA
jgi:hypothetical protein